MRNFFGFVWLQTQFMIKDFVGAPFPGLLTRSVGAMSQASPGLLLGDSLAALNVSVEVRDRQHLLWQAEGRNDVGKTAAHGRTGRVGPEPGVKPAPGDQWFKCFELHGPNGHMVVVRVDVTELVRLGRRLEATNRRLNGLSVTDSLTGLANRRYLDKMLTAEWQRATRNGTDLGLLMIDIDHFKSYNDHYGHVAGDACLRRIAHLLKQCTRRSGELAARYGGEEFVLVLPGAHRQRALEVAQLCMQRLETERLPHRVSGINGWLTVSIGLACLQDHATSGARDLVNAADAALYRAKAAGRARFLMATAQDWEVHREAGHSPPATITAR